MHPHRIPFPPLPTLVAGLLLLALTGCVSSGYKRSDASAPPAVPLDWKTGDRSVDLTLQTVVVYRGPGSWKANAYWDEYVVTLHNRGPEAVTLDRAVLTDFQGLLTVPGDNPWALEKQSRTRTAALEAKIGSTLAIGAGFTAASVGGGFVALVGAIAGDAVLATGGLLVAPASAAYIVYRNVSGKHFIEEEFARRRISLPMTLAPGQELTGSLFFPVTPGPRRLQLQLKGQALLDAIELPLTRLANLHLQPPASGENEPIPLRAFRRNGKLYTNIAVDMGVPDGVVALNGQDSRPAPATIEVEIDASGRIVEGLEITGSARASRRNTLPLYGYLVIPEGTVPPARVEFTRTVVRQVPYFVPARTRTNVPQE